MIRDSASVIGQAMNKIETIANVEQAMVYLTLILLYLIGSAYIDCLR